MSPCSDFDVPDVALGGPAGSTWSILRIFGGGSGYSFSTDQATLSDGTFTVQIPAGTVHDLAGNPNVASNLVPLVVDRHAPTTSPVTVTIKPATTLGGSAIRVNLNWSGTDVGPAGIASYDVARSYDGAAFQTIASAITGTSMGWSVSPGHTYRFEVRARDKAGNLGAWHVDPAMPVALTQQTSSAVHYSGSTSTTTSSVYSGGSERSLAAAGASASYTTSARALSFVTTVGPTRGFARVYIDGVFKTTLDLNDPTTTYRFVAYSMVWSSVGTHTIKIVSVGSPFPRVDIDAFGVIR